MECASVDEITNQSGPRRIISIGPAPPQSRRGSGIGHDNTRRETPHSRKERQIWARQRLPCPPGLNSTRTGLSNPFHSPEEGTQQFAYITHWGIPYRWSGISCRRQERRRAWPFFIRPRIVEEAQWAKCRWRRRVNRVCPRTQFEGSFLTSATVTVALKLRPLMRKLISTCRKLVIVGDGASGKTSLCSVFTLGYFPKVFCI